MNKNFDFKHIIRPIIVVTCTGIFAISKTSDGSSPRKSAQEIFNERKAAREAVKKAQANFRTIPSTQEEDTFDVSAPFSPAKPSPQRSASDNSLELSRITLKERPLPRAFSELTLPQKEIEKLKMSIFVMQNFARIHEIKLTHGDTDVKSESFLGSFQNNNDLLKTLKQVAQSLFDELNQIVETIFQALEHTLKKRNLYDKYKNCDEYKHFFTKTKFTNFKDLKKHFEDCKSLTEKIKTGPKIKFKEDRTEVYYYISQAKKFIMHDRPITLEELTSHAIQALDLAIYISLPRGEMRTFEKASQDQEVSTIETYHVPETEKNKELVAEMEEESYYNFK